MAKKNKKGGKGKGEENTVAEEGKGKKKGKKGPEAGSDEATLAALKELGLTEEQIEKILDAKGARVMAKVFKGIAGKKQKAIEEKYSDVFKEISAIVATASEAIEKALSKAEDGVDYFKFEIDDGEHTWALETDSGAKIKPPKETEDEGEGNEGGETEEGEGEGDDDNDGDDDDD